MEQIAVIITTQEEWDEYIEYAEKMGWKWVEGQEPRDYTKRGEKCEGFALMLFGDKFRFVYLDHKIVSLREAIGEVSQPEPKKVKLIKPFAGLPIGEYAIDEYNEYYIHIESNNANIHKDVVQGMKDHFEPITHNIDE